ncbi:MAG: M1 family metallopeptidase [Halobacteriales archaeon]|nr:M1 family metallopeptidase [Halobacteriales archaeon]
MSAKPHRLPEGVKPRSYELRIRCSPDEPRFAGEARIAVELAQDAQAIEVHARDLAFRTVHAEQQGQRVEGQVALHPDTETATFRFPHALRQGSATLDIRWDAPVAPSMVGLYLSQDGAERCLVTQCEATDARAIFPCWDEPAFKATLQWAVTAPRGLTALANGPLVRKQDQPDGWTRWEFAATPPVSSYLAAMAVGKFGTTPEVVAAGVPFRVYAMEGKEHLGLPARDGAARMLPWYNDYFGVAYRFGKYDQVAVPSFSFGAMENAGLVVFRATRLLMDAKTAGWKEQRDITLVVAHEFAHQWFGNHVTMRWWDDLWLNESFAEWIAHRCVDSLWPEHEVWLDFQARTNRALGTDALGATHPIYQPVATPAEAAELFDAITYGKGSSVMRMLESFLGQEAFRRGLQAYMAEFGGANARGADLWRHMARASDQPVERIMEGWVGQPGHPVLHVRHAGQGKLELRQERFLSKPGASPGGQRWDVPVVVRYRDDAAVHTARHLLRDASGTMQLDVRGTLRWLHANAHDLGFYRTDPDATLLAQLGQHAPELEPAERVGLLRDQWALVRAGMRPPEGCFTLLGQLLPGERHYAVLDEAAGIAREAERLLEVHGDAAALEGLWAWARRVALPVLQATGPDAQPGEAAATGLLRSAAYRIAGGIGRDPRALRDALRLADRELADAASVDANLARAVVDLAAQQGDAHRFDVHVKAYQARRDAKRPPQESDRYLGSLGGFRRPELVERALGLTRDGTVPKQSIGPLLVGMLREPHAQAQAWRDVQQRWPHLRKELGDSWAAQLAESTGFLPPAHRAEVEAFLAAHARDLVQSSARARDLLTERAAVFERVVPPLAAWARSA